MSFEPQYTKKEYIIVAVTTLLTVLVMALAVYGIQTFVANPPNIWVTIVVAVVIGALLFFLASMMIDLYRRGGNAARALKQILKGNTRLRLQGVATLRFIGRSAAF